jgi:arylsulfatase
MGLSDNTLILFVEGDNGASGEGGPQGIVNEFAATTGGSEDPTPWLSKNLDKMGGPQTYEIYPAAWAFALNTPFQWMKQIASHLGGTRNGMVVSWPARIKDQGGLRSQYHHLTDIAPTLLEAAKIQAPSQVDGIAQKPFDGVSMVYSFDDPKAESRHHTQYYEIFANHGIYHDGWLANSKVRNLPWNIAKSTKDNLPGNIAKVAPPPDVDPMDETWELYDLTKDYSQSVDLAAQQPEKLKEMLALFDSEARRNDAYPIQDSRAIFRGKALLFQTLPKRQEYVYWGPNIHLPQDALPPIFSESFSLEADVVVPAHATGVIVAAGSYLSGWSFYLKDGKPVAYDAVMQLPGDQYKVMADKPVPAGPAKIRYDFDRKGMSGVMTISVDGVQVAQGSIDRVPLGMAGIGETFDTGRDAGLPVSDDYKDEGVFPGTIREIVVDRKPSTVVPAAALPPADGVPRVSPGND